ncbi:MULTISPECIES: hypothetical protein [unclassified Sphingomonas]|uniref:hypothetical protein n=1 Tax=unclassified Sphingomonas TaxID=196159 RepID=UPI00226AF877|nr:MULTISPECIES: hypothetical protein [unclassified Sphingomonas]
MYILQGQPNTTTYAFDGGRRIVIEQGGESLANNSYGLELEFCSHDSSVFTFTHVEVLHIDFALPVMTDRERLQLTGWKLESDSGGVLELVTPPLFFAHVADAHRFRENCVAIMTQSVVPNPPPQDAQFGAIYAVLLSQWLAEVPPRLADLCRTSLAIPGMPAFAATITPWLTVGGQLNQENIDDGINIAAARMRHYTNRDSWDDYVQRIVLSRSEKDWRTGYSSQLNMPMTLPGYFLYCHQKYRRSIDRMAGIQACLTQGHPFPPDLTDTQLRKNIETWFWRSVIWDVFDGYARAIWPHLGGTVWTDANLATWSVDDLTKLAMVYVMTAKMLTGALGALSEPGQLKIQLYAWFENSTVAMNPENADQLAEMRLNLGDIDRPWLEYHSAMKDLTGLWFKGALFDVIHSEHLGHDVAQRIGLVLANPAVDIWSTVFAAHLTFIRGDGWNDLMEQARPDYIDDLEDLDSGALVRVIDIVRVQLGTALCQPATWPHYAMPGPAQRPFLHYADAPPWEGRYDTMYAPIPYDNATWTYLIEHRFN